jgi:hypothetical protein
MMQWVFAREIQVVKNSPRRVMLKVRSRLNSNEVKCLFVGPGELILRFENLCRRESRKRLWIEKSVGVLKESKRKTAVLEQDLGTCNCKVVVKK